MQIQIWIKMMEEKCIHVDEAEEEVQEVEKEDKIIEIYWQAASSDKSKVVSSF